MNHLTFLSVTVTSYVTDKNVTDDDIFVIKIILGTLL